MKYFFLISGFLLVATMGFGQTGNFRTLGTGQWGTPGTWERDADSNGTFEENPSTVAPTSASGTVEIRNTHIVTVAANVTVDQVTIRNGGELTINNGISLTLGSGTGDEITVDSGGTLTNNGNLVFGGFPNRTVVVNGNLGNNGSFTTVSSAKLTFNSGSNYFHLFADGGTIPMATWNSNSTVNITGMGSGASTPPANLAQTFGNFVWNTPLFDSFIDLGGAPTNINGDFRIENTGGAGAFAYNFGSGVNTTFTIGGDFLMTGGFFAFVAFNGSPGTLNINNSLTAGKGLKLTGGFFQVADDDNVTVNCNGVFELSNGNIELAATTAATTLNVTGNFTHSSGNLFSTSGTNTLNFNGTSPQSFVSTQTPSGTLNYNIPVNATLTIPAENFISGTGNFTVSGTLEVGSTNANGAMQSGSSAGNIRVSGSRTYNAASTIVYNGLSGQFIGNGHPSTSGVNTTINNANGISLIVGTPFIITTNLTLTSGNLNIGNGAFTLDGSLTANSNNVTVGSGGSITINGSATVGTFPFPAGNQTFTNFTLNNPNGVTFANNVTLTGALTLTLGDLTFNNQTLTLNGSLSSGSGFFAVNNASTLVIGGSGALGTIAFSGSGNTLNTLTIQRTSGTVDLNSNLTISNALNLTNGVLNNLAGLAMGNGATIFRASNGSFSPGSQRPAISAGTYHVTYNTSSSVSTGNELPTAVNENVLGNLTINGPVTLSQNVTVNGTVLLQSSTFSAGSNTLKMRGASWSKAGGSFDPGTGQVTFDGNTTISTSSGNPRFGNIRVETARTLTFPASTIEISGNITFLAGSIINNSGGTILLNGTGVQSIGAGGATLAHVSVTKTGGSVSLSNALNITGDLNINTATVFVSAGNLTLRSTSDGTSGNASIGDLSAGGSVTGDVIVQRFMSGEGRIWRYLSSPIQNASVASWKDDFPITGTFADPSTAGEWPGLSPAVISSGLSFFRYNETVAGALDLGWENYPSSGLASANPLEIGRGYSAFVRIDASPTIVDVTGPINSGDQALPVSFTGSAPSGDNGWNLVGNPYPATIDWDDPSWTKTNISSTIQIRDNASGIFQTWNGSIGSMGSGRIATGQAFWVKATSGSPALVVREVAKTSITGTFFKEDNTVPNAFEVTLARGTLKDYAYIWFNEEATEEVDDSFDAIKFKNDIFDFSTQTLEGKKLAINTLPFSACDRQIKIDISTANSSFNLSGDYTMSFAQLGTIDPAIQFTLVDHFTGTSQLVTEGFEYTFTIDKDDAATFGNARLELQLSELIIDLQIEALGSQVCSDATPTVTLPTSQPGILYSVSKNGTTLSELLAGNGGELVFNLPQQLLGVGDNLLEVVANNGCSQQLLVQTPVVRKEIIEQVSEVEESTLCKGGSLTLKAFGATAGGTYRWYDSPTAATELFESPQNEFITPALEKTKTFYVAIANPLGCEGERVAVLAQIINFDDAAITEGDNTLSSNFITGNQWFKDGTLIPGATAQTFKPEETGVYKVEVTIGTCTTSAERVFTVTGLEDEAFAGLMVAYPNPVKDELLLEIKAGIFAGSPRIVDLMGREIGTIDMKDEGTMVRGKFDFRGRASGIYLLQLSDKKGKLINQRIVKQ